MRDRIREIIRKNAYLIEDLEGQTLGVFNSRQIRPHRESRLEEINIITPRIGGGDATNEKTGWSRPKVAQEKTYYGIRKGDGKSPRERGQDKRRDKVVKYHF